MSTYLQEIIIRDFKSFDGIFKIGPLKAQSLCAIIGPNGTGKSNILDAIAFCVGEQSRNLRVTKMQDLICKSTRDEDRDTFVTCIFKLNNETRQTFKRSISRTGCQYEVDGKIVIKDEYHKQLENLRIYIKAQNFIIYQNDVNSIISASEKDRTIFFERISHSIDYKEQYDYSKNKFDEICKKIKQYRNDIKMLNVDHKNLIYTQKEGEKLSRLFEDIEKTTVESMLFDLYVIELQKKKYEADVKNMDEKKKKLDGDIEEIENNLQCKKTRLLSLTDSATLIGNEEKQMLQELETLVADNSKIEQQILRCEEQIKKSKKRLEFFVNDNESRERQLVQLSEELEEVKEEKKRFIKNSSEKLKTNFDKMEKWDRTYDKLRGTVAKRVVKFEQQLNLMNREMQPLMDELENEKRKRDEIKLNIRKKEKLNEENKKRIYNMHNRVQEIEKKRHNLQQKILELDKNIKIKNEKQRDFENELEIITEQCIEYSTAKEQRNKIIQENKIVETLRQSFPGVHDRVYKLIKPIHERYTMAFTRVFGSRFSSIIVNNTETALKCIKYLRSEKVGTETFLPLDENLQVEKLKEHLRSFYQQEGIRNVVLLYDIIAFEPEFERVALHIAGNILVCETDKVANHVAYNMPNNVKYNCVSLDGTHYRKSGLFTGGMVTLEKKATILKAAEYVKLEQRRNEIREILKKNCTQANNSDLQISNKEVEAVQLSMSYQNKFLDAVKKESEKLEEEISELNDNLQNIEEIIASIEVKIDASNEKIKAVQMKIYEVEDEVFADFCIEVNIPNIRKYEQSMRSFEEIKLKELEYDRQCSRIESLLTYEKEKGTNIEELEKWRKKVEETLHKIEQLHETQKIAKEIYNKSNNDLEVCHNEFVRTTFEIENLQKEITGDEETLKQKINRQLALDEHSLSDKVMETFEKRHDILLQSKINDRPLPLINGDVLDMSDLYVMNDDCLSKQSVVELYEQENEYKFDYSCLKTKPKSITQELEINETRQMYKKKLDDLRSKMLIFEEALKVSQELMTIKQKLKLINSQLQIALKVSKSLKTEFHTIQKKRYDAFMNCFENTAQKVDDIYKVSLYIDRNYNLILSMYFV
ncbi:hypothetical protein PV327_005150 [Microctonus hyperodae]|uniref:SMC hinge domain-containing protein n=1 Tax=Microctonus hyperodae TaxID=165561 RepID=A0AA39KZ98_MICHY|nr:hypothetical protein PV327_005150 [Microctonus hyperodae]